MKFHRLMFGGNGRRGEGGFSLIELAVTIVVIGTLLALGVWVMYSSKAKHDVNGAALQIANDLRMCRQLAESQRRPWGAVFYRYDYVDATWDDAFQNKYRIFSLGIAPDERFVVPDDLYGTVEWNLDSYGDPFDEYPDAMPVGFSDRDYRIPVEGLTDETSYISFPKETILYSLNRPRTTPDNVSGLYIRFVPVGNHVVAQYWGDDNDGSPGEGDVRWRDFKSPCEMLIRDKTGSSGYKQAKVTIYPLGDVKVD